MGGGATGRVGHRVRLGGARSALGAKQLGILGSIPGGSFLGLNPTFKNKKKS